jgi:general secretion pathway protein I
MDRILAHNSGRPRPGDGFTLLEVMVALAVLAIALTSIFRLQGQTVMMNGSARFYSLAPQLARAKLTEVEQQEFKDMIGGSGDFGDDFPGYSWTLTVEDLPSDLITDPHYHLVRMTLTVSQHEENNYQLRTYRFVTD